MRLRRKDNIRQQRRSRFFFQRLKRFFQFLTVISGICLLFWLIFFSPLFAIEKINLEAENDFSTEKFSVYFDEFLERESSKFIPRFLPSQALPLNKKNFLFLNQKKLKEDFLNKHLEIEKIEINLDIRQKTLNIVLQKRNPIVLWCFQEESGDCYFLDRQGVVFTKAPEVFGFLIPKIMTPVISEAILRKKVLSPEVILKIKEIFTLLKGTIVNLEYFEIKTDTISPFIKGVCREDWYFLLDFNIPTAESIMILLEFFKKNPQIKIKELEYVDLRYLPKIYYQ